MKKTDLVLIGKSVCDAVNIYPFQLLKKSKLSSEARQMFCYIAVKKYGFHVRHAAAYISEYPATVAKDVFATEMAVQKMGSRSQDIYIEVMNNLLSLLPA